MLTGEYRNTIDEKGRVLIPSRLRNALDGENSLVITRSVENCLWIMSPLYFEFVRKNIMDGNGAMFNADTRLLQRFIIGQAMECEIDKAGRLLVPPQLRAKIGLNVKEESVLLGISSYMELWSVSAYETFLQESEPLFNKASQNLSIMLDNGGNKK
ncbi:MAG: division/cell wall cluster transcriptional repressor MraZ [Spirochaetia bacterium]|nr:division/cell wall cluster transcriptional repressor MraZ [Spirochaetia bacterium]